MCVFCTFHVLFLLCCIVILCNKELLTYLLTVPRLINALAILSWLQIREVIIPTFAFATWLAFMLYHISIFIFRSFFCSSWNIWSTDCDGRYTNECKSVVVHLQHAAHQPHPAPSVACRTMVDTKEHIKQLFTHRDVTDTGLQIPVLCENSELWKDEQHKYYYSHNRCDITSWVVVLGNCYGS